MKKIFRKNLDYILFILTTFLFVAICGYSQAGIKKIPQLTNSATIQNSDLLVFENLATNKTNNITFEDLVLNFPLSNIYTNDGTLTGNRILDGDNYNHALDFTDLSSFNIYATNFYSESQVGNTIENGAMGIDLQAMGTGQTLTLQGDIVNLGGVTDTYFSFLNQDDTQNKVLVLDGSDKLFWRDASSFANNIYTADGTLLSNRVLNGDNYSFDLSMAQISNFGVEANEISLYSNGMGTFETNGNLNLLSNENLSGAVAKNTDLRSIPDWDLTSDLSGRLYSGNDVLDLFGTLGVNIRGTGFFNKRTSNNISHYIFAGDTTGTGGTSDTIALGIGDFGLTNFITEFELVRDDGFGNGSYRVEVANPTSYYNFNVKNEGQLLETFANTGFTSQRSTDISNSFYDYLSNNHNYSLKFEEAGGQYLELHNQDTVGPENSYTRMFRTNIQNSVSDGILSNGTTLNLTGFNIYTLPQYANIPSEQIVVRDNTTGDLKDSIGIDKISKKKAHVIIGAGAGYTANLGEFVIFQGVSTGAYTGEILTLPNPTLDGDTLTIKVKTNDVLRLDGAGYLIDGNSTFDIDGTIISGQQPSVTLEYDLTLNEWQVI